MKSIYNSKTEKDHLTNFLEIVTVRFCLLIDVPILIFRETILAVEVKFCEIYFEYENCKVDRQTLK